MKIFLSYSSSDTADYKIEEIVNFLEFQDDIKRVLPSLMQEFTL